VIRGTALYYLVKDYSGPRFFLVRANHESFKRHVWRKLGQLPPLPLRQVNADSEEADLDEEDVMGTTFVNERDGTILMITEWSIKKKVVAGSQKETRQAIQSQLQPHQFYRIQRAALLTLTGAL
jgi:hypothetical protein